MELAQKLGVYAVYNTRTAHLNGAGAGATRFSLIDDYLRI